MLAPSCAFRYHDAHQNAEQASEEAKAPDHFDFGGTEIDGLQYRLRKGGKTFELSGRELKLLQFFHARCWIQV